MGIGKGLRWSLTALAAVSLVALAMLAWGRAGDSVQAEDLAEMALVVSGSGVSCDGDTCSVPEGGTFTLAVDAVAPPELGYILIQTYIDYGLDLEYFQTAEAIEEVIWPDGGGDDITLRGSTAEGTVTHGALTSLLPPQPVSTYTGTIVQMEMGCTDSFSETTIRLVPSGDPQAGTDGALYTYLEGSVDVQVVPKTNAITLICGEAPEPPDGDGDGDGDGEEPTALPPSGTTSGLEDDGGMGVGLWVLIGALVAAGMAALGLFGYRVSRGRQLS